MTNDVLKVAKYFNVPVEAEIGELLRLDNGVPMENKNIANPDEVTRRGKNARKKAEKYTWQEKNEKYQAIYEELLKK